MTPTDTKSETPRTDAIVKPFLGQHISVGECEALLDHSRQLERELNATINRREELHKRLQAQLNELEAKDELLTQTKALLKKAMECLDGCAFGYEEESSNLRCEICNCSIGSAAHKPDCEYGTLLSDYAALTNAKEDGK